MILGVSGHRPHYWAYDKERSLRLVELVRAQLQALQPERVITGMALGMDLAVAKACVLSDVPFEAAIPFRGQHLRWGAVDQREYMDLLMKAAKVTVVTEGEYSVEAMLARNAYIVANSHEMLVLHNGSVKGGTAHAVGLAKQRGLPTVNIWKEFARSMPAVKKNTNRNLWSQNV